MSRPTMRGTARDAILNATISVIAADGLDAVTHRRVAEQAGVSPGSTTHHFSSRADLIRAAFIHYHDHGDRLLRAAATTAAATTDDPLERVAEFLTEMVRREFADERLVRVEYEIMLAASNDEQLAAHLMGWEGRWVAILGADLEAAGRPRPVELARTLINLVRGFELERLVDRRVGPDDFRRRLGVVLGTE